MNGIVSFKIELERPDGVYSGGEMVVGKVTLVTSRDIETRGIHIKKQCCGFTRFTETIYIPSHNEDGKGTHKTTTHVNKKQYEELRCTLLGDYFSGTGSVIQRTVLPAGTFERAFAFPLHVDVIGSVEVCFEHGDLANIRHLLNAFVDLGNIYDPSEGPANRSTEIPITILPSRQLPSPDMLQPIQNFNYLPRRIPRLCFFSKGTYAMSAKLWRQAYAPGEALDFAFSVANNSSVSLVMTVTIFCLVSVHSSSKMIEHSIHRAYVEPHTTYEIGYDSLNPDREVVASSASPREERKLVVPTVPLTFRGLFSVQNKIEFTTSTYQGWETSTTASFNL